MCNRKRANKLNNYQKVVYIMPCWLIPMALPQKQEEIVQIEYVSPIDEFRGKYRRNNIG